MKVDQASLQKIAIECKIAVKDFAKRKQASKLINLLKPYDQTERNYILSMFDRYGMNIEFEKSGIRMVDDQIQMFKFGFESETAAMNNNPLYTKLRIGHLQEMKRVKSSESLITIPTTQDLQQAFGVVFAKNIFNVSLEEAEIYCKIKTLKSVMDFVSENGITQNVIASLNKIFNGLNYDQRNKILELFDTTIPKLNFKGVRYIPVGRNNYTAVDKHNKICKFKYNCLHLRKTLEIIEVWKTL